MDGGAMNDAALSAVPLVFLAMLAMFGFWVEAETRPSDREAEAIQRGYAIHCPRRATLHGKWNAMSNLSRRIKAWASQPAGPGDGVAAVAVIVVTIIIGMTVISAWGGL